MEGGTKGMIQGKQKGSITSQMTVKIKRNSKDGRQILDPVFNYFNAIIFFFLLF